MAVSTYLSIINLNVNGLCAPIKRHRVAEWISQQDLSICCLQETHFRAKNTHRLKVRGWTKILHANGNENKAGVTILISDKIDFKTKSTTKDKEEHYITIKASIQGKDVTFVNVYGPNIGVPKYISKY